MMPLSLTTLFLRPDVVSIAVLCFSVMPLLFPELLPNCLHIAYAYSVLSYEITHHLSGELLSLGMFEVELIIEIEMKSVNYLALQVNMISNAGRAGLQIMVAKDIIPDLEYLTKCFEDSLMEMKDVLQNCNAIVDCTLEWM
ncbi:O-acyltransferase WSD1, C-terminal [Dillenia turbinata]|uniref:O-acyltransferase WSD1, C-terminal n=1 Tax=Dillenia turbinata TaxID=194707 RepID=A0AAN8W6Z5_9MAGN